MLRLVIVGAAVVAACVGAGAAEASGSVAQIYKDAKGIPLNLFPMIMSHDAGTGEMNEHRDHIVADWARTQGSGLVGQLDCGARSFDYRPSIGKDGIIYPHHSGVTIRKPMKESIEEIFKWSATHRDELVIIYLSHFDGDGCTDKVTALLEDLRLPYVKDCAQLAMPYSKALEFSRLPSGGHFMAVFDCTEENYDPSIECYGKQYVCYDSWPSNSTDIPLAAFDKYMQSTTAVDPTGVSGKLWMTQGHWQSSAASVVSGTLHLSSLLEDEQRSQVNKRVESAIRSHSYPYLNLLELDNVCDNGANVLSAIKDIYLT